MSPAVGIQAAQGSLLRLRPGGEAARDSDSGQGLGAGRYPLGQARAPAQGAASLRSAWRLLTGGLPSPADLVACSIPLPVRGRGGWCGCSSEPGTGCTACGSLAPLSSLAGLQARLLGTVGLRLRQPWAGTCGQLLLESGTGLLWHVQRMHRAPACPSSVHIRPVSCPTGTARSSVPLDVRLGTHRRRWRRLWAVPVPRAGFRGEATYSQQSQGSHGHAAGAPVPAAACCALKPVSSLLCASVFSLETGGTQNYPMGL